MPRSKDRQRVPGGGRTRDGALIFFALSKRLRCDIMGTMKQCHACRRALVLGGAIGRRDACPACGADLRCCMNCTFYDRAAPKQCREPVAELVQEKSRSNYCDYFAFAETAARGASDEAVRNSRKALDDLFKK